MHDSQLQDDKMGGVRVYTTLSMQQNDALEQLAFAKRVTAQFLIYRAIERMLDDAAGPQL